MNTLIATHAAATWALVGLIWMVQLVHYPLFAKVGVEQFRHYHALHSRQMTWIVAPLMLVELVTAVLSVAGGRRELWLLLSLLPLAFVWLATWRVQIPLHHKLSAAFDPETHRRLVSTNWWRTGAWTLRGGCVLYGLS